MMMMIFQWWQVHLTEPLELYQLMMAPQLELALEAVQLGVMEGLSY